MGLGEIENVIKSFYGKLNDKNAEKVSEQCSTNGVRVTHRPTEKWSAIFNLRILLFQLKTISDKIKSPNEVKSEVKTVLEEIRTWKNTKTKLIIDCLNGVAQATPRIALALFLPTVLSLTNNIFRF